MAFSDLSAATGPLHLINTAINLQGSKTLNRRGRNADFFFFSSAYSGSSGAVETGTLVPEAPGRRLRRRPMCPVTDDPLPPRPDRARGIVFR